METNAGGILQLLIEEGIYDVLSEAFEKETDETLLVCNLILHAISLLLFSSLLSYSESSLHGQCRTYGDDLL